MGKDGGEEREVERVIVVGEAVLVRLLGTVAVVPLVVDVRDLEAEVGVLGGNVLLARSPGTR
jgi:hypothetical protein